MSGNPAVHSIRHWARRSPAEPRQEHQKWPGDSKEVLPRLVGSHSKLEEVELWGCHAKEEDACKPEGVAFAWFRFVAEFDRLPFVAGTKALATESPELREFQRAGLGRV